MGCHQFSAHPEHLPRLNKNGVLKVVTLNYCGILRSPFEFYSSRFEQLQASLSAKFQQLRPTYLPDPSDGAFRWNIQSLDKRVKEKRYCPFYRLGVGIENNAFVSRKRFEQIWQGELDKELQRLNLSFSDSQRREALLFDFLAFHTLLSHLYPLQTIDQAATHAPQLYLQTYTPLFQQVFLDERKKLTQFLQDLEKHEADVIFLQEVNIGLAEALRELQQYHLASSSDNDTMILAKKSSLVRMREKEEVVGKLSSNEWKAMNWNGHTSVMAVDDYLLINGHLSSQKEPNTQEVQALQQTMATLQLRFPHLDLILGCDANAFIPDFDSRLSQFPLDYSSFTTLKKRTAMQVQGDKAEHVIKESKDRLMSTLSLQEGKIITISGESATEQSYLPREEHPYDHFLVYATFLKN